jgi:hypothetical protein
MMTKSPSDYDGDEPNTGGHGSAVKGAISSHKAGHVPFPTMGSSTPTNGGKFGGTAGKPGVTGNELGFGGPNATKP